MFISNKNPIYECLITLKILQFIRILNNFGIKVALACNITVPLFLVFNLPFYWSRVIAGLIKKNQSLISPLKKYKTTTDDGIGGGTGDG